MAVPRRSARKFSSMHLFTVEFQKTRTCLFFHYFIGSVSRMWNQLPVGIFPSSLNIHSFKSSTYRFPIYKLSADLHCTLVYGTLALPPGVSYYKKLVFFIDITNITFMSKPISNKIIITSCNLKCYSWKYIIILDGNQDLQSINEHF